MKTMRSIHPLLLAVLLAGCVGPPKYGEEKPLSLSNGTHPIWAVAPAVNLSGEASVDPILQADLVFEQLQAVNNLTVIPVNRVIQVYAALHITRVESEEQAAIVCEQLGCDALVIPTMTIYDPYNPPKMGAALQLLGRGSFTRAANVDARELIRQAAPMEIQPLPAHPNFIQAVGMYDAANGTVRDAVLRYAKGRNDPTGPLAANQYFVCMDDYSGFVYHTLIEQLLARVEGDATPPPVEAAASEQSAETPSLGFSPQSN
jgi:hypothetical protein